MKNILIIQTAYAGDLILTTPLIHAAYDRFTPCRIDVLCIPSTASLIRNNPFIHELILYDKRVDRFALKLLSSLRRTLKKKKYDIVLSPHRSFRSALIARFTGAEQRITFHTSSGSFFYTHRMFYDSHIHEVDRVLSLLPGSVQSAVSEYPPQLFLSASEKDEADEFLRGNNISRDFICIAPGSVWETKRWTSEGFTQLARQIIEAGYDVVLIGGADDAGICQIISGGSDQRHCCISAGRVSFPASAELIRRSRLLISNDSAPVHLASAMGTAAVDIYGPTSPSFGFAPYKIEHRIVRKTGLSCSPCHIHGQRNCPIKTFICMKELDWKEVYSAAEQLLAKKMSD